MLAGDLDRVDSILRLAFATARGLVDPSAAFGDADLARTRFRAAPDCAWAAEIDGEIVGSVFAARWGSFGVLGPLSVDPSLWDHGIGSSLLRSVLDTFDRWAIRQAGLFTFAGSVKHIGLYQKHGFWPGALTVVSAKTVGPAIRKGSKPALASENPKEVFDLALDEIRELTDQVFGGLDLGREIMAVRDQQIGDTVLLRRGEVLEGIAICHRGAGSEAGSGTCYVKFAAVRPGPKAAEQLEALLDGCEAFAVASGMQRLVAGVNTARLDTYRRLLARGFRMERIGASMFLRPAEPTFDTSADYVLDDLR